MTDGKRMWGGRFRAETDARVQAFTSSWRFDRRLWPYDIAGSIAHARMLAACGIITLQEGETLVAGLERVREELAQGTFPFRQEYEDIHMNIEVRLTELVGPVGGKLHTARSRNDQVATDMHMYIMDECRAIQEGIVVLQGVLLDKAEKELDTVMPGYTHLQRAQPILYSHYLLAYFEMLVRDYERFADCYGRANRLPLGAGALAGTTFPIDRQSVAQELGFAEVYRNSIDAVSDRDFVIEFLAAAAITMLHLSRLCEELIIWCSQEFGFLEMDDSFATGSSIMPQKKNPDVAELVRGKTGRVYGSLISLLTTMKGLPLAYHTDMQEDKQCTFDAVDTLRDCLHLVAGMMDTVQVRRERMAAAVEEDFSNATDLADYLVRQGLPFREAHAVVGRLVLDCLAQGKRLGDLSNEEWQAASPLLGEDARQAIDPRQCVAKRCSEGGTSPAMVAQALAVARQSLAKRWPDDKEN
jgi:argininosuccinate lyase